MKGVSITTFSPPYLFYFLPPFCRCAATAAAEQPWRKGGGVVDYEGAELAFVMGLFVLIVTVAPAVCVGRGWVQHEVG